MCAVGFLSLKKRWKLHVHSTIMFQLLEDIAGLCPWTPLRDVCPSDPLFSSVCSMIL